MQSSINMQLSTVKFQQELRCIINKLGEKNTLQQALMEMRIFLETEVTDNERMTIFLSSLTDFNAYVLPQQMREQIRIHCMAAEIFCDCLIPFLPKVLANL
jgi:hypothetical protein